MWKELKEFLKRFGILFVLVVFLSLPCWGSSTSVEEMSDTELWTELTMLLNEQTQDLTRLKKQANSLMTFQNEQMTQLNELKKLWQQEMALQSELKIQQTILKRDTKELQTLSQNLAEEVESQQKTINLYKGLTIAGVTISVCVITGGILYFIFK